ncbi:GTP-binding protein EngB [hydrothermal vent metagenome]|uniref:GTP-binding protein EngB n=1 Tax=hydrothermal vent metagenome TaxID=652676 RepID=A0A3B1CXA9_9ZZZZ
MKVKSAKFSTSAANQKQYPKLALPEVAFAGRSNVGKSSLINSLTGRKGLVKVSKTPGKTRLLNFFDINGKITFVDMPGYGFANVPIPEKKKWGEMVGTYLEERKQLKVMIQLLDARRKPNEDDRMLLEWYNHSDVPFIIVFTKIDKIPKTRRGKHIKEALSVITDLVAADVKPVLYSSHTGEGKKELWAAIWEMAGR